MSTKWLEWAQKIQSISQIGLEYSKDKFDLERFEELKNLSVEIITEHSLHDHDVIEDIISDQQGYATPKIDVRGVIFKNDKILLVKERADGKWTLPGGWADINLSASENVIKEIREESGYDAKVIRLLAVYDREKHPHEPKYLFHIYKMFFLCEIIGGEPLPNLEVDEIEFFDKNNLPELSIRKITHEQIDRMYKLRSLETTDFD